MKQALILLLLALLLGAHATTAPGRYATDVTETRRIGGGAR